MTAKEIFDLLNEVDEQTNVEAKSGGGITDSVLETICAFANEPNLGAGYILIGAKEDKESLFPQYIVDEVLDPDKVQSDLASQCAVKFNIAIRPKISIEQINGKNVAVIKVQELIIDKNHYFLKNMVFHREHIEELAQRTIDVPKMTYQYFIIIQKHLMLLFLIPLHLMT